MSGEAPTPTEVHRVLAVEDDHCMAIPPMRTIGGIGGGHSGRDQ